MDLFHAVTQSIDKVLTCHWYDDFKAFKMDDKKTMKTEPGGESTQYAQIYAVLHNVDMCQVRVHQDSDRPSWEADRPTWWFAIATSLPCPSNFPLATSSTTDSLTSSDAVKQKQGENTAENIRYGQNISESGMGGKANSSGSAGQDGGYGGAPKDASSGTQNVRAAQGYGPGNNIGA
jgi:hypothetical protein